MFEFKVTATGVELEYMVDFGSNQWLWEELQKSKEVRISQVFRFRRSDLRNPPTAQQNFDEYVYKFRFGKFSGGYLHIPGQVLGIKNEVHISRDMSLRRGLFAAERNISIFGKLSRLLQNEDPIVIGGGLPEAIPQKAFEDLLKKFPGTRELDLYAGARVQTLLSQYLGDMGDARAAYEAYLDKRKSLPATPKLDLPAVKELEIQKYVLIRDLMDDALKTKTNWSERQWQDLMLSFLLLLFPKYIKVLQNITIPDYYSNPEKKTDRYIDVGLVDTSGNLDIIELKRPFDDKIFCKSLYRGNSIPTAELSGSIMQAEKYLFHLSKWGVKGEENLTKKYASVLPKDIKIKISNPKAIIIVGRDQIGGAGMTASQLLDFELIRRKYANMIDIITYDDLLRRLNNTIAALET